MIDRIFSAALTFCLLIAGTLAIGSALFGQDTRTARTPMPVIELPTVTVTGQRIRPPLPQVGPKKLQLVASRCRSARSPPKVQSTRHEVCVATPRSTP